MRGMPGLCCLRQAAIVGIVTSTGYLPPMAGLNRLDVLLLCTCDVSTAWRKCSLFLMHREPPCLMLAVLLWLVLSLLLAVYRRR